MALLIMLFTRCTINYYPQININYEKTTQIFEKKKNEKRKKKKLLRSFQRWHQTLDTMFRECQNKFKMACRSGSGEIHTLSCQKCAICKQKKRFEWLVRIDMENKTALNAWFLTLTYNDANIPRLYAPAHKLQTCLRLRDVQNFVRKLKRENDKRIGIDIPSMDDYGADYKLRYVLVGEYGKKHRPHYHLIVFNMSKHVADRIHRYWNKGWSKVEVPRDNGQVANYCTKYMLKESLYTPYVVKPFRTQSDSIGLQHALRNPSNIKNGIIHHGKYKLPMPKYWRYMFYDVEGWEKIKEECEYLTAKYHDQVFNELAPYLGNHEQIQDYIDQCAVHYENGLIRKAGQSDYLD